MAAAMHEAVSELGLLARDEAQCFGEIVFVHRRLKVGEGFEVRLGLTVAPFHEQADDQPAHHTQNPLPISPDVSHVSWEGVGGAVFGGWERPKGRVLQNLGRAPAMMTLAGGKTYFAVIFDKAPPAAVDPPAILDFPSPGRRYGTAPA